MSSPASQTKEQVADTIVRCIDSKDLRKALAICQQLNRQHADYAYGWYLASFLMQKVRHYADAIKAVDRALQLSSLDKYQLHKIRCHFEANDLAGAIAAAGVIKDKTFIDPQLHSQLGSLLHLLGENSGALHHYSKAIELDPGNADHYFNRAAVQRFFGDVAGAEAGFNRAIELKPEEFEAYNARAHLRQQTRDRNHIVQLKEVIARSSSPTGLVQLQYALAKEYEDIGSFDEAFAALQQGADTKRRHMRYRVDTDLQIIDKICEVYGTAMFAGQIQGFQSTDPIFVLGMPRTGTTLVERILGSHSSVFSAGELNNFSLELIGHVRQALGPKRPSRLEFVAATAMLDFKALGEAYIRSVRPLRDGSPCFIDKLPFNFLYAGLIHLALPRAKIINLKRHPMDTCYSVYKQLFRDAYPFSYDLDELGQYYIAYHDLMRHWNTVMPGVICTIQYEALVTDTERESRRLLEYCGLPWEDQCLRFQENRQASTTASALQVRQPVYASSVGKWRHFERQLAPLRRRLEDAGIDTQ
jgi:tetratricopeptide (TPR) repeat protein